MTIWNWIYCGTIIFLIFGIGTMFALDVFKLNRPRTPATPGKNYIAYNDIILPPPEVREVRMLMPSGENVLLWREAWWHRLWHRFEDWKARRAFERALKKVRSDDEFDY